ncbi:hypothetical protein C8R47DRAFT_1163341 [Mycena vitilis]|nr:hypothetical protein C8R47DRAFT_1163341 [Mycena vitilis]
MGRTHAARLLDLALPSARSFFSPQAHECLRAMCYQAAFKLPILCDASICFEIIRKPPSLTLAQDLPATGASARRKKPSSARLIKTSPRQAIFKPPPSPMFQVSSSPSDRFSSRIDGTCQYVRSLCLVTCECNYLSFNLCRDSSSGEPEGESEPLVPASAWYCNSRELASCWRAAGAKLIRTGQSG